MQLVVTAPAQHRDTFVAQHTRWPIIPLPIAVTRARQSQGLGAPLLILAHTRLVGGNLIGEFTEVETGKRYDPPAVPKAHQQQPPLS